MIHPVRKTIAFSFVTLMAAAAPSAAERDPSLHLASMRVESVRFACSSQSEIERGWESQQALLEARLAAKALDVSVPGAIISAPFPTFAPYRTDVPVTSAGRKASKQNGASRRPTGGRASTNRSLGA